ncbi:hypothetical protein CLV84_2188 [Neolewinella xylanilytica]|uniref:Uncharacterized protein n=1 Tax=Neolewinella xylanilytica TaxID=1514080 RepID=A0A2S6I290_9BACT|nr:hypothetical protein [Neolewinella xylanilytica]PPK85294.1 hypothetical protein CLV84_2188 [Neolewinella xylanilytica]
MKPEQGPDYTRTILIGGLVVLSLLLLLRIYPPLAFTAFLLAAAVAFVLVGGSVTQWLRGNARPQADESEFAQRVSERLRDCRQREERFRDEGERILKSIATLRDDLSRNTSVDPTEVKKAEDVIRELEAEFSLRHAKAGFFAECAQQLKELLDRHRLMESISARRRELRNLRQTNYDDEAVVEETRFHIEQDSIELDTIVELSNNAAGSSKAEQANALRRRLEQLRGTLGRKDRPEQQAS